MRRLRAMHDAQTGALVGFAIISDEGSASIDDDLFGSCRLWKLLIACRLQRCGQGLATLDPVMD
jgi:hypothetical protein